VAVQMRSVRESLKSVLQGKSDGLNVEYIWGVVQTVQTPEFVEKSTSNAIRRGTSVAKPNHLQAEEVRS